MTEAKKVVTITDVGPDPLVVNIANVVDENEYFRSALWTGNNLQVTVMNIKPGEDIGAEIHEEDQFIKIEDGRATVFIGRSAEDFYYQRLIDRDFAVIIPAGTWHNIKNSADAPLKLYSVYAPPHHKKGTTHTTRKESE